MRRKINLTLSQAILITAIIILTTTISVLAATGTTDAPNAPGLTSSYTLENIYQRLVNGTDGSQSTFTNPAVAPGTGSMHTLNDIMSAAPALDNTNGATANQVLQNRTFWGLTHGQWGLQTGTIPVRSDVTGTDGQLTFNIPNGYYSGRTATAADSDLLAGNILDGVEIFGVTGNIPTGSDVTGANGLITFDIPDGYYSGARATANDSDLLSKNIVEGVNIFGVTGTYNLRFTDNDDGTVTDKTTGLMWTQNADLPGQMITFQEGSDFCNTLDFAGHSDWQLPTVDQLSELTTNPIGVLTSTPHNFTNIKESAYWTTTDSDNEPGHKKLVYMGDGTILHGDVNLHFNVWCMRN